MRTLVTGANGLLGSNLVRELLKDGHQVRALVRKTSNAKGLEGLDVEIVHGDVRDAKALRAAADGCEVLFHTAAVFSYWGYDRDEMIATARDGTIHALDAAKDAGLRRVVLTSSTTILGDTPGPTPMDESYARSDAGGVDYFETKTLQEKLARERAKEIGIEVVYPAPAIMLGPHDHRPSTGLESVINYLQDPLKLTYPGGCNYLHAADAARGHMLLADKGVPGERYILCGDNLEWTDAHRIISELAGVKGPGMRMGRGPAYVAATLMELGSAITKKPPLATRKLAKQIGRYFFYKGDKAKALGFSARPAREVFADAIAWLLIAPHMTEAARRAMKPAPEVLAARAALEQKPAGRQEQPRSTATL